MDIYERARDAPPDLVERALRAIGAAPASATVGFHTAAALLGFGLAASDTVHIVVPVGSAVPRRAGLTVHQSVVAVEGPVSVLGVACTPPARTAIDLARTLQRADALVVLDAAAAAGLIGPDDLIAELKHHLGLRGVRQARGLVALIDPRARTRQETLLRLILRDARLTSFVPQLMVRDAAGAVGYRIDLGDPVRRIGVEHDRDRARTNDRRRHQWLLRQGWAMRYFSDRDIAERAGMIAPIVHSAHVNNSRSPRRPRAITAKIST